MQHQQVGDALVLIEGQAERWFGLGAGLGVAVHTVNMTVNAVDVSVNSICMAVYSVYTVHSIRDIVSYKDKFALDEIS